MTVRSALVLGATGLVGRQCLDQLLAETRYDTVHAIVRKPLEVTHPKLKQHVIAFTELADTVAQVTASEVFCCLGTTIKQAGSQEAFRRVDYEYPLVAAKSALASGARQFLIVTSLGADAKSSIFYSRVKGEVERDLCALPFPTVHVLQPSMLLGERGEQRIGEAIGQVAMRIFQPLMVGAARKYRAIEAAPVARAMIALAKQDRAGKHTHKSDELERLGSPI